MERAVHSGEFYRHFKNKLYQIITVAKDSETGEEMVVYQALYGSYAAYVRPRTMFLSEVDREKYPDVTQRYRFEKVFPEEQKEVSEPVWEKVAEPAGETVNPFLLAFLEADKIENQLDALNKMKGHVGVREIESICLVLETACRPGTIEEQLDELRRVLRTRQRYDGRRLRRND